MRASTEKSVSAAGLEQDNNVIIIRNFEVQHAAARVEKILAEHSAAKVSKQTKDGKVIFRAEISKEKLKDFIEKIKSIGSVEEKGIVTDSAQDILSIVIEITGN